MPRIVDVQVSWLGLVIRLLEGAIFGGIALLFFYYLPTNVSQLVGQVAPPNAGPAAVQVISQFFTPSLAPIGLLLGVLTASSIILKGGRVYGGLLVILGALYLAYFYLLFHGGTLVITIPAGLAPGLAGSLTVEDTALMLLFMLAPLLTVFKGVLLVSSARQKETQP